MSRADTIDTCGEPALPIERIAITCGDPATGERLEPPLEIEAFAYSAQLAIHRSFDWKDLDRHERPWVVTHRVSGMTLARGFRRAADAARCAATIHASGARLWLPSGEMSSDDRRRIRGAVQEHA